MALLHLDVFIIAAILFCAVVAIVYMLRQDSSLPNFFTRDFASKGAASNEESQGQIKSVNWKKGLFRLTLVFSVLFGIFAAFVNAETQNSYVDFFENFFIFFAMTWLIYFAMRFVIRGFANKK